MSVIDNANDYDSALRLGQTFGEQPDARQTRYISTVMEHLAPIEPEWFLEAMCGVTQPEPERAIRVATDDEDDSYDAERTGIYHLDEYPCEGNDTTDSVGLYAHAMGQVSKECFCSNCMAWRRREGWGGK